MHSLKAQKLEAPRFLRGHSRPLVRVEEVCLSHRLEGIDCSTSRIMTGDLAKIVTKLRRENGGNIIIEGGPRIGYEFIRRNQVDDPWVLVIPMVFGCGPRYWTLVKSQTHLKLRS